MEKPIFIVEKTNTGYSAYAQKDGVGVGTSAKTLSELKQNSNYF